MPKREMDRTHFYENSVNSEITHCVIMKTNFKYSTKLRLSLSERSNADPKIEYNSSSSSIGTPLEYIYDGNSEICVRVWSKIGNLI